MQFMRSDPVEAGYVKAGPRRPALCDYCRDALGDKRVLTRDVEGRTRRFCADAICIEAWRRYHHSVFRRR